MVFLGELTMCYRVYVSFTVRGHRLNTIESLDSSANLHSGDFSLLISLIAYSFVTEFVANSNLLCFEMKMPSNPFAWPNLIVQIQFIRCHGFWKSHSL